MPTLEEIQKHVFGLVVSREEAEVKAKQQRILEPQTVSRLSAYRNGYVARLVEAMEDTYKHVAKEAGAEGFYRLVESYVRKVPPRSYNISEVGKDFPEFVEDPFLRDLARFEREMERVFHSKWEEPVARDAVSKIAADRPERMVFEFQPGLRIFKSEWNVFEFWRGAGKRERKPNRLIVYRADDQVKVLPVEDPHFDLLSRLSEGRALGEALSYLENEPKSVAEKLQRWFGTWMELGWIVTIA
jgi:hypothetical protein